MGWIWFLLALGWGARSAVAQPVASAPPGVARCGSEPSAVPAFDALRSPEGEMPLTGPVRALVVFVQFADDVSAGDGCARGSALWPIGQTVPTGAASLLAETPGGPTPDSSLTALYRLQSQGTFELYGSVYGYTTALPEAAYFGGLANLDRELLAREVLDALLARGVSLADYDDAGDGFLDQLVLVIRSFQFGHGLATCSRATSGAAVGCASGITGLSRSRAVLGPEPYGVRVSLANSGLYATYQILEPHYDMVSLLAHEIGHQLWTTHGIIPLHLEPVVQNGVPATSPTSGYGASTADASGTLALMLGGNDTRVVGPTLFASAAERALMSDEIGSDAPAWIECQAPVHGQTYTLGDALTTGDCLRIPQGTLTCEGVACEQALYLSGLYRGSPFAAARVSPSTYNAACPGCLPIEGGLPATGLLLEMVQRRTSSPLNARRDILPADRVLDSFQGCDLVAGVGATAEEVFGGDLWQADGRLELHPFTQPNVYGYSSMRRVPASVIASGAHWLTNFREGPDGRVAFDYRTDFLEQDSLVAHSDWSIGPAFGALSFESLRMDAGTTLTVESGADLTLGTLDLREGTQLVLQTGSSLTVRDQFLSVSALGLRLQEGTTLRLLFDLDIGPETAFQVDPGASLFVGGDLTIRSGRTVPLQGALTVDGRLTLEPGAGLTAQGVGAHLTVAGPTVVGAGGELTVGDLGTARLDGGATLDADAALQLGAGSTATADTLDLGAGAQVTATGGGLTVGNLTMASDARVTFDGGLTVGSLTMAPGAIVTVSARGGDLTFGSGLVLPAGTFLAVDQANVTIGGSLSVAPGAVLTLVGSTVKFPEGAALVAEGAASLRQAASGRQTVLTARDPAAGWAGARFEGDGPALNLTGLVVEHVVGGPAVTVGARGGIIASSVIRGTRGGGGLRVEGGTVDLRSTLIENHDGAGLSVSEGGHVTLALTVRLLNNRGSLSADGGTISGVCMRPGACASTTYEVRRDTTAAGGFDVELRHGGAVHLPFARWPVTDPGGLVVIGDSTGTLDVEPLAGQAMEPPPEEPVTRLIIGDAGPNPTFGEVTVRLETPAATAVRIAVSDVLGRRVYVAEEALEAGRHRVRLAPPGLPAGSYVARVAVGAGGAESVFVRTFVVVR